MTVLNLVLKKKWFDMIASGEKKEEYRDLTDHWKKRLVHPGDNAGHLFKQFDTVCFRHGYATGAPRITLQFLGIEKRGGKLEWGAEPEVKYFVIKLGEIV